VTPAFDQPLSKPTASLPSHFHNTSNPKQQPHEATSPTLKLSLYLTPIHTLNTITCVNTNWRLQNYEFDRSYHHSNYVPPSATRKSLYNILMQFIHAHTELKCVSKNSIAFLNRFPHTCPHLPHLQTEQCFDCLKVFTLLMGINLHLVHFSCICILKKKSKNNSVIIYSPSSSFS